MSRFLAGRTAAIVKASNNPLPRRASLHNQLSSLSTLLDSDQNHRKHKTRPLTAQDSLLRTRQLATGNQLFLVPSAQKLARRSFSNHSSIETENIAVTDSGAPSGDLFNANIDTTLLNKSASIRRTFSPRSNAQAMLTCGGPILAAHASFDPQYDRARAYIQNHAVGPAVLSPILISGLVGALVEAALPQSFLMGSSMKQIRTLIVGVEVEAKITVSYVVSSDDKDMKVESDSSKSPHCQGLLNSSDDRFERKHGYEIVLLTEVKRVMDGAIISEGSHNVWLPDYDHM